MNDIDIEVVGAQRTYLDAQLNLELAGDRRALAFALANEHGYSSGDIARLLGITPMQALHIIRTGHRLIKQRRARRANERRAA